MFMTKKAFERMLEPLIKRQKKQNKCLQQILDVIQWQHDELKRLAALIAPDDNGKRSRPSLDYLQKLSDYQSQMDGLAGQVVSELPTPPKMESSGGETD